MQFSKCLSPLLLLALVPSVVLAAPARTVVPQPAATPGLVRVPQDARTLDQAISQVVAGGAIELAAGTYVAPTTGFHVTNPGKSFTIRAASGAAVVLDGGASHPIFVLRNTNHSQSRRIGFENLIFRNGGGGSTTLSAGVTVDAGEARFVGCRFENNAGAAGVAGGAVKVRNGSNVTFMNCTFIGNSSPTSGGAMLVNESTVEVMGGAFLSNRVNLPDQEPSSHGGAINVTDGTLHVSNALFQDNQAGWVGGAIFALGTWTAIPATPHAYVSVTRSTFKANFIATQPCCPPPGDPTGGAIHVEDQTTLDVKESRFVDNQAQFGGALDSYRALINVSGSTFQGNGGNVAGTGLAVGGAICALSNDFLDSLTASGQNPRPAGVTVADSLLQGRHAGGGPTGNAGGCLLAAGDGQHLYGLDGLTPDGTLATNRTPVQITGSVFDDCDVVQSPTAVGSTGGAINGSLVALTLADSLLLDSDAIGRGSGGALFLAGESAAQIARTTFAGNTADSSGGAIFSGASNVAVDSSRFIANGSPGSLGAALYAIPLRSGLPHAGPGDASGVLSGTLFSQNTGVPLWDVDFGGASPVNTLQYNGNDFFSPIFGDRIYVNTFTDPGRGGYDVGGLNNVIVNRFGGPSTVKAPVPNRAPFASPAAGSLKAIPITGSPSAPSTPFLAYAWAGGSATLNGVPLPRHEGLIEDAPPGSYTLAVDGVTVDTAAVQGSRCTADPVLCVANERFHVQVHWQLATGESGDGHPVGLSGDTGYFWFFNPGNVELVVKVLDGRALNHHFWVFYGALSNVKYTLTVTDTVTGAVKTYSNPQNRLASVADTAAFLGTGDAPAAPPVIALPLPPGGGCAFGSAELCLGNRFRVGVTWRTGTGTGSGTARPLTGDTGYFWFFSPANVELVVKILDGTSLNDHFWVFYGALSNVEYTLTITDTQTGRTKTYVNRQGTMASVADTSALPGP